jgi:hypothetical protein
MTKEKRFVPQFHRCLRPLVLACDITANGGIHEKLKAGTEHVGYVFQSEMWVDGFGGAKVQLLPSEYEW